jgi:hypothetical protein
MTTDIALRRYFRTWGLSRHCADCREMCGCNLVTPRSIGGSRTSPGSLAMLAAMRRAGLIASELGPCQRLAAHGEKMLTYKAEQRLGTGKR